MRDLILTCDHRESLKARELAEFLYYFQVAYAGAMKLHNSSPEILLEEQEQFLNVFPPLLQAEVAKRSAEWLFQEAFAERELTVEKLSLEDSVMMCLSGWGTAMMATALLAGAEVHLGAECVEARLRTLHQGLCKLKAACGIATNGKAEPKKLRRSSHRLHAVPLHTAALHH